jgi:hypothetical protein
MLLDIFEPCSFCSGEERNQFFDCSATLEPNVVLPLLVPGLEAQILEQMDNLFQKHLARAEIPHDSGRILMGVCLSTFRVGPRARSRPHIAIATQEPGDQLPLVFGRQSEEEVGDPHLFGPASTVPQPV